MATKAGVWIDHPQAVVVLVTGAGQEIKRLKSDQERSRRPTRSSRLQHKYTPHDFIPADRREQKLAEHRKHFYDEVLAGIRDADALLILGPGEAKRSSASKSGRTSCAAWPWNWKRRTS